MSGSKPVKMHPRFVAIAAAIWVSAIAASCTSTPSSTSATTNPAGISPSITEAASANSLNTASDNSSLESTDATPTLPVLADAISSSSAQNDSHGAAAAADTAATAADPLNAASGISSVAESETNSGAVSSIWLPRDLTPQAEHLNQDSQAAADAKAQAPNPSGIRIPRLGVHAPVIALGLQDDGTIEVPASADFAGWWLGGPEPGETGPAVILGHVDSEEGPGVFFHLRYLSNGDEIHIDRVDGSTVSYVVERKEKHGKDNFPTDAVYGPTEEPTLRLVTCGGDYDFGVRAYPDNVVVFASQINADGQA